MHVQIEVGVPSLFAKIPTFHESLVVKVKNMHRTPSSKQIYSSDPPPLKKCFGSMHAMYKKEIYLQKKDKKE